MEGSISTLLILGLMAAVVFLFRALVRRPANVSEQDPPGVRTTAVFSGNDPEFFQDDIVLQQVLHGLLWICSGEIDLVDGDDHRDAGVLGVADRLDGLWHDLIVSGNDEDNQVGHLGTACPHGREGLMTRSVQEGHALAVR